MEEHRRPIFLVGMPGSGKSTLGRGLSALTGLSFIDLDLYIQGRFSCSVADIFARKGEDGFRRIEHNLLHEVGEMQDVIVACGGGTPCFFDNMDYMLGAGTVVHLVPQRERLHERLCRRRAHRPAIARMSDPEIYEYIDRTSALRNPVYERAHLRVESSEHEDRRSIDRTALSLIKRLFKNNL